MNVSAKKSLLENSNEEKSLLETAGTATITITITYICNDDSVDCLTAATATAASIIIIIIMADEPSLEQDKTKAS